MKRYLKLISLFIVPILVFFACLEYVLRKIPNDIKYKTEYMEKHGDSIEVLILGSSHSLSFLRPALFHENTFNAANLNQTLKFDYFILNKYRQSMSNLKYVILPISYATYFVDLESSKDKWRIKDYKMYMGYRGGNPLAYRLEVTNGSTPAQLDAAINYITKGQDQLNCSGKGFGLKFSRDPQTNMQLTGKMVALRHTSACDYKYADENIEYLKQILDICREGNISVVLYTAPAYHTYREKLNEGYLKRSYAITDSIVRLYPNVRYKNYFEDNRFKKDMYRDVDHLNETGAGFFTKILIEDFGFNTNP